jgi:hypothetical protein
MPIIRRPPRTNATLTPHAASRDDDDARSVAQALRAVLLFLALAGFVAWVGIAQGVTGTVLRAGDPLAQGDAGLR